MNGLDTNVLIRYLVADDESQAAKAKRYIESGPSHVNGIVLSEVVWVLESAYGFDKEAVITVPERLLSTHEWRWRMPTWRWRPCTITADRPPGLRIA